jgi:hypothetical protein
VYPFDYVAKTTLVNDGTSDIGMILDFPTTHVLVNQDNPNLIASLESHVDWAVVYRDQHYRLYAETTSSQSSDVIEMPTERDPTMDDFWGELSRFRVEQ